MGAGWARSKAHINKSSKTETKAGTAEPLKGMIAKVSPHANPCNEVFNNEAAENWIKSAKRAAACDPHWRTV